MASSGVADLPALVRREGLGAALDLGTTTLVARVYDLETAECLHQAAAFNPQRRIAADVMGRVSAAMDGRLSDLRDALRTAVHNLLGGHAVREAVAVGNTTMLHLFAGVSPASYATAPFQTDHLFGERLIVYGVNFRLPRCSHAFFGADAVAAARMAGLGVCGDCELLADIGTNGEIALWRGDRRELTVTSVAAGPAFERPGVTGSEIIAAIADGLSSGAIDATGLVTGKLPAGIAQTDVRDVQLAKAAVYAGITTLLEKTNTPPTAVTRFSLAGGFGSALDLTKAVRMGLFPSELLPVTSVCGNLAIEGASAALLNPSFGDATDRLATTARHLELGGDNSFSNHFMSSMTFPT